MKRLYTAPQRSLQRWFWFLLLLNLLYIFGSGWYLQPLGSGEIIRLEVAKEVPVATNLIEQWKLSGKFTRAVQSVYIDYLFIFLYTTGLIVACIFISRLTRHEILIRAGKLFSSLLIVAGICDFIENAALLKNLRAVPTRWNVLLAYDMAAAKFSIIILSLLFIVVCLLFALIDKLSGE